jgi:hypothetical protein
LTNGYWRPSERTTVSVSDKFLRYRTLRGFTQGAGPQPAILAGRDLFSRNVAQLSISRRTSPKGTLQVNVTHGLWNFDRVDRIDQQSVGAALQYSRVVTRQVRIGGSLSYSRQDFDFLPPRSDTHTDYYNASLTLRYAPAETFLLEASVGPTNVREPVVEYRASWIQVEPGSGLPLVALDDGACPLLKGQPTYGPSCHFVVFPLVSFLRLTERIPYRGPTLSGDWTYFADVSVDKRWERGHVSLAYRRDQGGDSALSFASVADTIEIDGVLQITPKFSSELILTWESRDQTRTSAGAQLAPLLGPLPPTATLPGVPNLVPIALVRGPRSARPPQPDQKVRSLSANLFLTYMLKEYLKLEGQVFFTDQNASAGSGFAPMDRLFVRIGLDFEYPALRW